MMRRLLTIILLSNAATSLAQDIPLFSQKLTNSFLYNPALAGQSLGSLTYGYRRNFSNVSGAPEDHFLSAHTPVVSAHAPSTHYRLGFGINLYQENVNVIRNSFATAAFAWHLRPNEYTVFSAGISTEFSVSKISPAAITNSSVPDPVLNEYRDNIPRFDASFGVNYQTRYVRGGFALNKISSTWLDQDASFACFFSSYVQGRFRMRAGKDRIEPYFSLRKFSPVYTSWDIGVFYTYLRRFIAGAAVRKGHIVNGTLAFQLTDYLLIGYSREVVTSSLGQRVGTSNEITLRLDFSSYSKRVKNISDWSVYDPYESKFNKATRTVHTKKMRRRYR